ncbi:MAG: hypothetical protein OEM41_10420, partial [Ignavibacteria bacterium]|nr:hypothetical protein [Ignavibacteria bacterium]
MNDRRRSPSTMGHLARVILFLTLLSHPQGLLAQQGPKFWRGVFLFAIRELPSAAEKNQFFTTLKDSLSLNVFQVRTFGDRSRINYFLNNNHDLWVLNQDADLARLAEHAEDCAADSSFVRTRATMLLSYPKHLRFYLKDEPTNLVAFDCVSRLISSAVNDSRAASVTAFAHSEELIPEFVAKTEPAELMIDPYFIRNNVPHPSLLGRDSDAMKAGIRPWTTDTVSQYGHYLGGLQNDLNQVLSEQIRPAASAMKSSRRSLIIIPQLHGELFRSTNRYDTDS